MTPKHDLPDAKNLSGDEKRELVYDVFQNISETYDKTNDAISFGMHRLWKKRLLKEIAALGPKRVLDVASGTGDMALWLAEMSPDAIITGTDLSENMLAVAKRRRDEQGFKNVDFIVGNAMELPFEEGAFDVALVSFGLRNMPDYKAVLSEMARTLKVGGKLYCIDSSYPTSTFVKPFFRFYFKYIMPVIGSLIAKAPREYQWLNDSTEAFLSKQELANLFAEVGMKNVGFHSHMLGGAATHWGTKK